jgi:hypothetical protein
VGYSFTGVSLLLTFFFGYAGIMFALLGEEIRGVELYLFRLLPTFLIQFEVVSFGEFHACGAVV